MRAVICTFISFVSCFEERQFHENIVFWSHFFPLLKCQTLFSMDGSEISRYLKLEENVDQIHQKILKKSLNSLTFQAGKVFSPGEQFLPSLLFCDNAETL